MHPVREHRRWHAHDRVEQPEAQAGQQAELGVAEMQFVADRFGQDREELPIDEIDGPDRGQHEQRQGASRVRGEPGSRRQDSGRGLVHIISLMALFHALPQRWAPTLRCQSSLRFTLTLVRILSDVSRRSRAVTLARAHVEAS